MCESEKWKWSLSVVSDSSQPHGLQPSRLLCPWNSPGETIEVGCPFLLQRIFLTQASNPCLQRLQVNSLPLSYQGISIDLYRLTRTRAITKGDKWTLKPGLVSACQTQCPSSGLQSVWRKGRLSSKGFVQKDNFWQFLCLERTFFSRTKRQHSQLFKEVL